MLHRRKSSAAQGMTLIWNMVTLAALVGFCSLAVDWGRVQMVKAELQRAADASALYATQGLATGVAAVRRNAVDAAADNKADGQAVVIDAAQDVEVGMWDGASGVFTPLSGNSSFANAVRVSAVRTTARNNAVPLAFAKLIGKESFDLRTSAVAFRNDAAGGIIGLQGITIKNNAFAGGYESGKGTRPVRGTSNSRGGLGSNGMIVAGNNGTLDGDVTLGPGGGVSGVQVSGKTRRRTTPIPTPTLPAWTPGVNSGGVARDLVINGDTVLSGGTYWLTSLTVRGTLRFSSPATLIVNGPIDLNGAMTPVDEIPDHLRIFQLGANTFDFVNGSGSGNNILLVAVIDAGGCDFLVKNNLEFRGRMTFRTIDVKNNADLYYDTALGGANGGTTLVR